MEFNIKKFSILKLYQPEAPKIRILQISDLHIDFEYQPNSIGACGQPLCCRNTSKLANQSEKLTPEMLAGYWGDYRNCDVPIWLVENLFDFISNNEKVRVFEAFISKIFFEDSADKLVFK